MNRHIFRQRRILDLPDSNTPVATAVLQYDYVTQHLNLAYKFDSPHHSAQSNVTFLKTQIKFQKRLEDLVAEGFQRAGTVLLPSHYEKHIPYEVLRGHKEEVSLTDSIRSIREFVSFETYMFGKPTPYSSVSL